MLLWYSGILFHIYLHLLLHFVPQSFPWIPFICLFRLGLPCRYHRLEGKPFLFVVNPIKRISSPSLSFESVLYYWAEPNYWLCIYKNEAVSWGASSNLHRFVTLNLDPRIRATMSILQIRECKFSKKVPIFSETKVIVWFFPSKKETVKLFRW
jgi:hypothetical protein